MTDKKLEIENTELFINVLGSVEFDLAPVVVKKKRQVDDYDYNDPFLEPFEGEFDAVDLECKLENFFVHKGRMEEDPKKIAKKFLRQNKKKDDTSGANSSSKKFLFTFEELLSSSFRGKSKYKKDIRFGNLINCMILINEPEDEFYKYLNDSLLYLFDKDKYEHLKPSDLEDECLDGSVSQKILITNRNSNNPIDLNNERLEKLVSKIEELFNYISTEANKKSSYSANLKTFERFYDDEYCQKMVDFILNYMKFYAYRTNIPYWHTINSSLEYLSLILLPECINKSTVKYHLSKYIQYAIMSTDYDVSAAFEGKYIKIEDCVDVHDDNIEKPDQQETSSNKKLSFNDSQSENPGLKKSPAALKVIKHSFDFEKFKSKGNINPVNVVTDINIESNEQIHEGIAIGDTHIKELENDGESYVHPITDEGRYRKIDEMIGSEILPVVKPKQNKTKNNKDNQIANKDSLDDTNVSVIDKRFSEASNSILSESNILTENELKLSNEKISHNEKTGLDGSIFDKTPIKTVSAKRKASVNQALTNLEDNKISEEPVLKKRQYKPRKNKNNINSGIDNKVTVKSPNYIDLRFLNNNKVKEQKGNASVTNADDCSKNVDDKNLCFNSD